MSVPCGKAIPLVLALFTTTASADRWDGCPALRGVVAEPITVVPEGAPAFEVRIGAPVELRAPRAGDRVKIDVRGPLRFTGSILSRRVSLRTTRPLSTAAGVVRLPAGAVVYEPTAKAGRYIVDVALPGGAVLRKVIVACDAVILPPFPSGSKHRSVRILSKRSRPLWKSISEVLYLHPHPGTCASLRIDRAHSLRWIRINHRDRWVQLRSELGDGTELRGWTSNASVTRARKLNASTFADEANGGADKVSADHGRCRPGGHLVSLRAGAAVWSRPRRGRWATTARTSQLFQALAPLRSGWVRVTGAPGWAAGHLCNFWVQRSAIGTPRNIDPTRRN